jgi:ribose 5-phosphate isomerase A
MNPKQRAGTAAVEMLSSDTIVGLGTGSTAECFISALAEALRSGRLRGIRGVPTSERSELLARQLKIPLLTLAEAGEVDVTVDGADEIDPHLNLIKGLGGALLREKIVAQNSRQMIVIADAGKCVDVLGTRSPLPVEVTRFAHDAQERFLRTLGCDPGLRRAEAGEAFITDNGNVIYDCRFRSIDDPHELQRALKQRAGVVESGLFLSMASAALVADENEVRKLERRA